MDILKLNPTELIRKKRAGDALSREELHFLVDGFLHGTVPDYQMSAFLMAVYFKGMDFEETAALTDLMLHSGTVVDLASVPGVKVDKHSTGGVGDKVSLILAPMVASCGVPVPMISGRGLGHTGGTLDKLESIPGFRTDLRLDEYTSVIRSIGVVMIGQTAEIAPADKRMYALRDVTGTVESVPLIAGSIMSKKLAEGIDALVLDIKTGRGAFMDSEEKAVVLAQTLIAVGKRFGRRTIGLLTDMNEPLGRAVGNWLEVRECIECMRGREAGDLMEVTYALGGAMLYLGKRAGSIVEGIATCREAVRNGHAWKKFIELVARQGGDTSMVEHPDRYPASNCMKEIKAGRDGFVGSVDALETGFVAIHLGAGRMKVDDVIDPKSGIVLQKKRGEQVAKGDVLATLYTDKREILEVAAERLLRAIAIVDHRPTEIRLVRALIDEEGVHEWQWGERARGAGIK